MQYKASEFELIIKKHPQEKKELIPILQDIQVKFNYLPQDALVIVSDALKISLINVISVATFYGAFCLTPRGKHVITICMGTACPGQSKCIKCGACYEACNFDAIQIE